MGMLFHIAEIALILALAYGLGWALGFFGHALLSRSTQPQAVAAAPVPVEAPPADALVRAPAIGAVGAPLTAGSPTVADEAQGRETVVAPAPDRPLVVEPLFIEAAEAAPYIAVTEPEVPAAPIAAVAVKTTDAEPAFAEPDAATEPVARGSSPAARLVRRFRGVTPDPVAPSASVSTPGPEPIVKPSAAAFPSTQPGQAWAGSIRGRAAIPFAPAPAEAGQPVAPSEPESAVIAMPADQSEGAAPPAGPDEDAAMRAIEGGWSRVGARALHDTPELTELGAAVTAAQTAVEQVLARAGIEASPVGDESRPVGLARPRLGQRDDLKQINGLGALDESTLNNLGIYHFDQIAGWSDAQLVWMENNVFARGRISREGWQDQARALAASSAA